MNMLSTITKRPHMITAAIFGTLALSFGAASIAADSSDVPYVVVNFSDLDISNPAGATTLYNRIAGAAQEVCQFYDSDTAPPDLRGYLMHKTCVHDAIMHAVNKVGERELFTVYSAMNHRHRQ